MKRVAAIAAAVLVLSMPTATAQPSSTWCADQSDIAVVGASSETSYGTTGYPYDGTTSYVPTTYGWVSALWTHANPVWGTGIDVHARNGALIEDHYPGGRFYDLVDTLDEIQAQQPDLVIVQLGVNEYVNNVTPASTGTQLRQFVDDVRSARPGVDVLLMIYPNIEWPTNERPWSQYATEIYETAVDKGTALLDLRQYIWRPSADGAGVWYSDDAHLNNAGQSVEFTAVHTLLWSWLTSC